MNLIEQHAFGELSTEQFKNIFMLLFNKNSSHTIWENKHMNRTYGKSCVDFKEFSEIHN